MNQKAKLGLILGGVIFVLAGVSLVSSLVNRIPQNPAGTEGNTTGNLYNKGLFCESDGKIYFSELTFYPCSGYLPFTPPEWDRALGNWITLPQNI